MSDKRRRPRESSSSIPIHDRLVAVKVRECNLRSRSLENGGEANRPELAHRLPGKVVRRKAGSVVQKIASVAPPTHCRPARAEPSPDQSSSMAIVCSWKLYDSVDCKYPPRPPRLQAPAPFLRPGSANGGDLFLRLLPTNWTCHGGHPDHGRDDKEFLDKGIPRTLDMGKN